MPDPDLSTVTRLIVTYNSGRVIADCLDAIPDQSTVVIDNDSSDNSVKICQAYADTRVVETGNNAGFGGGVNRGLELIDTTWALVINPDAIMDAKSLARLLACAEAFPEAGMIAPAIVDANGNLDRSHDKAVHRRQGMSRKRLDPAPEGPVCAEFLSGAAFMVRMDVAREVGGFDEAFFLFYEDDDFCWRIAKAGYSLILEPTAEAMHLGGTSTTPSARIAFRRDYHMGRSLTLYRQKHLGVYQAIRLALMDTPKLIAKALLRTLTGNLVKAARDWGRLSGTLSRLLP
jgi:N-acetylglucosaminyl-diphospho-decaprenol L-rhamnosyltransferase